MGFLQDFIDELTDHVRDTLPLPVPGSGAINLLTTVVAAKRQFVESLINESIDLPCVVIEIGTFEPDDEFGITNTDQFRAPVSIYYIGHWASDTGGTQPKVYDALKLLRVGIDAQGSVFTTFLPIEAGAILTDVESPVNQALLANSQVQVVSGCVRWFPGFLVADG